VTLLAQGKMEVGVPILDRVEGRATMQRKAVHSSLPKGTADKSDPYAAALRRLAHGCHGQLLDVTVSQNLREDAPIFATEIYSHGSIGTC